MQRPSIPQLAVLAVLLLAVSTCSKNNQSLTGPMLPDLVVTGVEVSQGTQNVANELPLVANRWTIVRVYVDDANDRGAESVTARLLGFRNCPGPGCPPNVQGPLPLPPLAPWNPTGRITVPAAGAMRAVLDDSFWFFLPKSWRELPGTLQIVAEVNGDGAVAETVPGNNTQALAVTFQAADMLRVRAVPLHLHQSWDKDLPEVLYECDEPDFWRIFLNMFRYHPIDRLLVTCPGAPLEPFPHDVVPAEIAPFEWDMSDADICMDANARLKWLRDFENLPGDWLYAGLISPSLGGLCNGWSGAASGDAVWVRMSSSAGSQPWIINGGVTLAHELGHSQLPNPDHILCKGNEGPPNGSADTEYPYIFPNCRFSAADPHGFYGLDVYYALWPETASQPTVLPNGDPNAQVSEPDLFPLMGYLTPKWTDPYTYCGFLNSYILAQADVCDRDGIDPNPGGVIQNPKPSPSLLQVMLESADPDDPLVLVSGRVSFLDGTGALNQVSAQPRSAVFDHVVAEATQRLQDFAASGVTGRFSLEVRNATGEVLYWVPILSEENGHETPVGVETFVELLAFPTGATSVALVDAGQTAAPLHTRTPSATAPAVTFSALSDAHLEAGTVIAWTGRDQDGDFLTYTLRYSPDGSSWHVIALDVAGREDFQLASVDALPGSTAGMLEILVNDGFDTTSDRLTGLVVSPKAPGVVIHSPRQGQTVSSRAPLVLSASVQDPEEGVITDDANLAWASSLDGDLGTGSDTVVPTGLLRPGTHTVSLSATDASGATSSRSVQITVE
jgi:hypothetical protein